MSPEILEMVARKDQLIYTLSAEVNRFRTMKTPTMTAPTAEAKELRAIADSANGMVSLTNPVRVTLRSAADLIDSLTARAEAAEKSIRDCQDELNSGRHFRHDVFKGYLASALASLKSTGGGA